MKTALFAFPEYEMPLPLFSEQVFFEKLSGARLILPSGSPGREEQEESLRFLLSRFLSDSRFQSEAGTQHASYVLASIAHECCVPINFGSRTAYVRTFSPVREVGSTSYFETHYGKRSDLGNVYDGDGAKFRGRGFVQNTGRKNAMMTGKRLTGWIIYRNDLDPDDRKMTEAFNRLIGASADRLTVSDQTFIAEPDLLLVPEVSYEDMVSAMFEGRYTGKKLTDYISGDGRHADYKNARRIINGDVAKNGETIAAIARQIEAAFRSPVEVTDLDEGAIANPGLEGVAAGAVAGVAASAALASAPGGSDVDVVSTLTGGNLTTTTVVSKAKHYMPGWLSAAGAGAIALWHSNPVMFVVTGAIVLALIITGAYVYIQRCKINADPLKNNIA